MVGLAILVGLLGVVVPLVPGTLLVAAAIAVWATEIRQPVGWWCAWAALTVLALGVVVKYAVPGRRLRNSGVPSTTLVAGGMAGIVGFFVIPVVGLVLGFVLGVYLAEVRRQGSARAWPATKAALRAVGLSILLELAAALVAAGLWVTGVILT